MLTTHISHFDIRELLFPEPSWLFQVLLALTVQPSSWSLCTLPSGSQYLAHSPPSPPSLCRCLCPSQFHLPPCYFWALNKLIACITMTDLHVCLFCLTLTSSNTRMSFMCSTSCTVWPLIVPSKYLMNEWMDKLGTWRPCFKVALTYQLPRIS